MKHFLLSFILLLIFLPVLNTSAQEGGDLQCPDADLAAALQLALDTLTVAQDQDAAAQYAAMVEVRTTLAVIDSVCLGIDFEGVTDTVHDPIYIPSGLYRVTATTSGALILKGIILDGVCDEEFSYYNIFRGRAETGAQIVFESEGCTMLWETSNIGAPYTVTFEKLR